MNINIENIKQLTELMKKYNIESFNLQEKCNSITLKNELSDQRINNKKENISNNENLIIEKEVVVQNNYKKILSPMAGTFYIAASPTSKSFVNVGDKITNKKTLCIIEAMKLMNEIEAEFSGTIEEILVANGAHVEKDQELFYVK